jgi:predicted nucleic acid-binding protein
MLFIYWLEDHPGYAARVQTIYTRMRERRDTLCTSVFTVGELLTGPYKQGAQEVASKIRGFFAPPQVQLLPFTVESANRYAQIRSQYRIAPADAIHLATAADKGVDLFLTNDRKLAGKVIEGIDFIAPMDVSLF